MPTQSNAWAGLILSCSSIPQSDTLETEKAVMSEFEPIATWRESRDGWVQCIHGLTVNLLDYQVDFWQKLADGRRFIGSRALP